MSLPTIHPRAFYGLKNDIKGNASYISENEILYPAGGMLILQNYTQKLQRYIKIPEKQKPISIICVSPSRKVAAVAERGERPCIYIYELSTLKKKKVLGQANDTAAQEYVSLSFSFDGKFLAAILGDPDWTMVYFQWEKGKIDSTVKANNLGQATQVACNPTDNSVLVIVGPQLFQLLSASEKTWRQYGWSKADSLNITSVAWLSFDRVIGGTSDGNLLLVDSGKLKAVYKAMNLTTINMKLQEPGKGPGSTVSVSATNLVQSINQVPHPQMAVRELINFRKGFAFACGSGMVHLFEKETNDKYTKRNMFLIPEPQSQAADMGDLNIVESLSISPQEDRLLATTTWSQMFSAWLWDPDMKQGHQIPFKMVGEQLHHGPVVGLSMCAWKPLFMTCGQLDRTVRVWNYETETQELVKQYQDEIFSVAIHPTGLYTLIGFSDKLRFMVLTLDDIHPCREFPIHGCSECCFSNNGHLFAAVNGNVIHVYSSVSFEKLYNLKGHNGKVKSLVWTHRDLKLVSCGVEGAIYEWDVPSGTRVGEIITKQRTFNSITVTTDGKTSFGTDSDGCITEVSESTIVQAVTVPGHQLDYIVLSHSNQMMFVTTQNGSVLSVQYPLQEPVQYMEYNIHNQPVTRMCLSYDDQTLITCSMDGSICIWKLMDIEGKTVTMDSEFKPSTDILISKADLMEKIKMIKDLSLRMHELETEHEYNMHKSDMRHAQMTKEVNENYCQAIEELKRKNEQMESDHSTEVNSINDGISRMKTEHEQAIQTLEANFTEKLIVEYDKYESLEARRNEMREEYERKLTEISHQREDELRSTVQMYETQLQERNAQLEELRIQNDRQRQEHEAITHQIEDDAEHEITELKTVYEKQLHEEREANLCLKGEKGVVKKKFSSSQKEIQEFKHQVYTLQQEQKRFQQTIIQLQRDISYLREETDDRDRIIQDKEKQICDLKRKNQELEKFKFVLNYKITELKNQIEPKDMEIKEKKRQMQDMEAELENLQRINTNLELQLAELRGKLNATRKELKSEHDKNREAAALLTRIRFDIHSASSLLQEPKKLKDSVKRMYQKYSQDSDFIRSEEQNMNVQTEFMRQREHLERTVVSIKRQVHKDTSAKQDQVSKIINENTTLITELNNLRRQLKDAHRQISDMESILGISSKYMSPKEAQARLKMAVQSHEEIHNDYKSKLEESERMNEMLREEAARLTEKLANEKQGENTRKTGDFSA